MSLLKCPECNNSVSEYAEKCPTCGCPMTVIKNFYNKNNGHIFSIINGEEKDVTYFVNQALSDNYKNNMIEFKNKMYNELDIYDVQQFVNAIKKCNGAPKIYNHEKASVLRNKGKIAQASLPHCPTCHSTNIKKIGTGERVASVVGLGILSKKINKTWKCCNCGYTW